MEPAIYLGFAPYCELPENNRETCERFRDLLRRKFHVDAFFIDKYNEDELGVYAYSSTYHKFNMYGEIPHYWAYSEEKIKTLLLSCVSINNMIEKAALINTIKCSLKRDKTILEDGVHVNEIIDEMIQNKQVESIQFTLPNNKSDFLLFPHGTKIN